MSRHKVTVSPGPCAMAVTVLVVLGCQNPTLFRRLEVRGTDSGSGSGGVSGTGGTDSDGMIGSGGFGPGGINGTGGSETGEGAPVARAERVTSREAKAVAVRARVIPEWEATPGEVRAPATAESVPREVDVAARVLAVGRVGAARVAAVRVAVAGRVVVAVAGRGWRGRPRWWWRGRRWWRRWWRHGSLHGAVRQPNHDHAFDADPSGRWRNLPRDDGGYRRRDLR